MISWKLGSARWDGNPLLMHWRKVISSHIISTLVYNCKNGFKKMTSYNHHQAPWYCSLCYRLAPVHTVIGSSWGQCLPGTTQGQTPWYHRVGRGRGRGRLGYKHWMPDRHVLDILKKNYDCSQKHDLMFVWPFHVMSHVLPGQLLQFPF